MRFEIGINILNDTPKNPESSLKKILDSIEIWSWADPTYTLSSRDGHIAVVEVNTLEELIALNNYIDPMWFAHDSARFVENDAAAGWCGECQ